jgi:hypothetical protein
MSLSYPVDFSKYCSLAVSRVAPHAGQLLLMLHVMVAPLGKSCTCTSLNNHYTTQMSASFLRCCQIIWPQVPQNYTSQTARILSSRQNMRIYISSVIPSQFDAISWPLWCKEARACLPSLYQSCPGPPRGDSGGQIAPGPEVLGAPFLCVKYFRAKDKISVFLG